LTPKGGGENIILSGNFSKEKRGTSDKGALATEKELFGAGKKDVLRTLWDQSSWKKRSPWRKSVQKNRTPQGGSWNFKKGFF